MASLFHGVGIVYAAVVAGQRQVGQGIAAAVGSALSTVISAPWIVATATVLVRHGERQVCLARRAAPRQSGRPVMVLRMVRFARPATAGVGVSAEPDVVQQIALGALSSWVCTAREKEAAHILSAVTWCPCVAQLATPSISPPTIKSADGHLSGQVVFSTRPFRALRTLSLASFWAPAVSVW